jgi:hypothetical protein
MEGRTRHETGTTTTHNKPNQTSPPSKSRPKVATQELTQYPNFHLALEITITEFILPPSCPTFTPRHPGTDPAAGPAGPRNDDRRLTSPPVLFDP